jgi:very-short-patch-repair endonuclease
MIQRTEIPNPERIIAAYESGVSLVRLSQDVGIGRKALENFLVLSGVEIRGLNESQKLRFAAMTAQERRELAAPSHNAWRGSKHTETAKLRAAGTRQLHSNTISQIELALYGELVALGHQPVQQAAVGIYNVDIAVGKIGVEIFGGSWHNTRDHTERTRFLLGSGWHLILIWVIKDRFPLTQSAVYYIHGVIAESVCGQEFQPGQYRVIKGTGQEVCRRTSESADFPLTVPKGEFSGTLHIPG